MYIVFIEAQTNVFNWKVDGYILTETGDLARTSISKDSIRSLIANPYLAKLPHIDFNYATSATVMNADIMRVQPVRFSETITKTEKGFNIHELYFIDDFPFLLFGVEVFIRFYVTENAECTNMVKKCENVGLENIILGQHELSAADGYSLRQYHIITINGYSITSKYLDMELRHHVYDDIQNMISNLKIGRAHV